MTASCEVNDLPGPVAQPDGDLRFPCSASQQRCWFIQSLNPDSTVLNIALRWEIKGAFSASTIEQAFQTIIDRHEILRTKFVEKDGEPVQIVAGRYGFSLSIIDLTIIPETEQLGQAEALGNLEARKPFDLGQLPLLRVTLLRLSADHAFCWSRCIRSRSMAGQFEISRMSLAQSLRRSMATVLTASQSSLSNMAIIVFGKKNISPAAASKRRSPIGKASSRGRPISKFVQIMSAPLN